MWSYWICETITGEKLLPVFPASGTFSRALNAGGNGVSRFVLEDGSPLYDKSLTTPWSRTLVRCWNDAPIHAGIFTGRKYVPAGRSLTVRHGDLRLLLAKRYPFGATSYWADEPNHIPGQLVVSGKSMRATAGAILTAGIDYPDPAWPLPIVIPSLSEGGSFSKTYYNYNFQSVADLLMDVQELGPDIDFRPQWSSSDSLEWLMVVGSTAAPSIVGDVFEFNMSVEEPRLTGLSVDEDALKQITGQFSVGEGFEVDMRVGGASVTIPAGIPAMNTVQTYKTEDSEPRLAEYALAAAAVLQTPTEQFEAGLLAGQEPGLENLLLGSILRVFTDDPWIGNVDLRLISFSGDESEKIIPDLQVWG